MAVPAALGHSHRPPGTRDHPRDRLGAAGPVRREPRQGDRAGEPPRGAFFDSVGDRVSDLVVLAGMAWYAQDRFGGHAALVPLAVLGASQLVSYIRAKADALGIDAKNGLMERGERIFVLCFALKFPADMLWLLWLVFALSMITAGQRFVRVWRLADKPPKPEPAARGRRAWREERAAWREGRGRREPAGGTAAGARRGTGPSAEGGSEAGRSATSGPAGASSAAAGARAAPAARRSREAPRAQAADEG